MVHQQYKEYSINEIIYELPLMLTFTLYSWAVANDPVNRFSGLEMNNSYTAQEADNLLNELKKIIATNKNK